MVIDKSGLCIENGTIEVVSGPHVGEIVRQSTPCDAWAYDGGVTFKDLVPGVEMKLRAEAPGFSALEKTVVPTSGGQMAVLFALSRVQ
jgi:hypothetical protein